MTCQPFDFIRLKHLGRKFNLEFFVPKLGIEVVLPIPQGSGGSENMSYQRTIKRAVSLTGIGLHSGKAASVRLLPASVGRGIQFIRADQENALPVAAHYRNITNTQLATTLGSGSQSISTVEHLLAALQGFGIDNLLVEVDGPEIPILDGSALPFCHAIQSVGVDEQRAVRPVLRLHKRIELRLKEKWAVAEPSDRLEIHGSIDWDHPAIGYQEFRYKEGETNFLDIAGARTFGFLRDVEALKKMGLALGGSLENAVVLDHAFVLNPDGLRYPDEFVRHKVLDALGDFKLAGLAIEASFKLHRAGHDVHRLLLAEIFKDPANYEVCEVRLEKSVSGSVQVFTNARVAAG